VGSYGEEFSYERGTPVRLEASNLILDDRESSLREMVAPAAVERIWHGKYKTVKAKIWPRLSGYKTVKSRFWHWLSEGTT